MLTLTGNGRLTKKPELRETTSGAKVTTVAIASSRRGSDDDPIYVDLVLWDAQAAFAAEHLVKGQAVTFTGRLEPRQWTDRDGNPGPRSRFTPWRSSTAPSRAAPPRRIRPTGSRRSAHPVAAARGGPLTALERRAGGDWLLKPALAPG